MDDLRVMLVDDHAVLRAGLQLLIDGQPDMTVVVEAGSAEEAVQVVEQRTVDVIVMDLSLPDGDGITLTEQIVRQHPQVRVVGLTRHEERGYMERMLEVGARGYVLKQSVADHLLTAIRTVAAGETYIDPRFTTVDRVQQLEHGSSTIWEAVQAPEATINELTPDEVAVLQQIAGGHTNSQIADQLGMPSAAVAEHRARAMQKLGLRTRIDVLRYAEAQGWRVREAGSV
jgi:two-component system, NarL family, response regulator NreC